jgi:hypothetical protein
MNELKLVIIIVTSIKNLFMYFSNFVVLFKTIHKTILPCFAYRPYMEVQKKLNSFIFLLQVLEPL